MILGTDKCSYPQPVTMSTRDTI